MASQLSFSSAYLPACLLQLLYGSGTPRGGNLAASAAPSPGYDSAKDPYAVSMCGRVGW